MGCFQSQVAGPGPQLEFIIPLTTERQGYLNLKSYWEFRQPEPARRLERLGHIRDLAGSTDAEHGAEAREDGAHLRLNVVARGLAVRPRWADARDKNQSARRHSGAAQRAVDSGQ